MRAVATERAFRNALRIHSRIRSNNGQRFPDPDHLAARTFSSFVFLFRFFASTLFLRLGHTSKRARAPLLSSRSRVYVGPGRVILPAGYAPVNWINAHNLYRRENGAAKTNDSLLLLGRASRLPEPPPPSPPRLHTSSIRADADARY